MTRTTSKHSAWTSMYRLYSTLTARSFRLIGCCLLVLFIIFSLATSSSLAADRDSTEYKIKAAMIHKFISFIEWPVNSYTDPSASITLGVVGDDPFGDSFENVLGKLVQGRLFGVLNLNSSSPGPLLDGCQILFFPSGISKQEIRNLLEEVADKPILTVGEADDFLEMGGMVNFIEDAGKVRFEVNVAPTEKAGIKIRSRLLRVAVRILGE